MKREYLFLAIALALVMVQPADALELFIGAGACQSDAPTVCDQGTTFNVQVSHWWPLEWDGWSAGVVGGHISHVDNGEITARLFGRDFHGSGQFEYITGGVRYEW